jgi:hypothetical protein
MANNQIFCDVYFEKREKIVREQIGEQLDGMKLNIAQLYSPCNARLRNARPQKELTIEELLSLEPSQRQGILSAVLYHDALWRLEAARIMLCIGMLNVAYSNLRSCLETVVDAHIVENLDTEAIKFLKGEDIEPTKIAEFIPEKYDKAIIRMKKTFGNWGIHCSLRGAQLGIFFGPNTFEKMVSGTKIKKDPSLHTEFKDAATTCLDAIGKVFLVFTYLIHKGTKYHRGQT